MAGVVAISYLLHKSGHHKLERAFPIYASGDSAYGVGYSFAHRQGGASNMLGRNEPILVAGR